MEATSAGSTTWSAPRRSASSRRDSAGSETMIRPRLPDAGAEEGEQADGAAAGDEDGLAGLKRAAVDRAQGDAEGLGEGGLLQPGGVGEPERLVGADGDALGVATGLAVAGADLVGAEVGDAGVAEEAVAAGATRVDDDRFADRQGRYAGAEGADGAGELVAHDRLEDAGGAHGGLVRSVFVDVGAADAGVGDIDRRPRPGAGSGSGKSRNSMLPGATKATAFIGGPPRSSRARRTAFCKRSRGTVPSSAGR